MPRPTNLRHVTAALLLGAAVTLAAPGPATAQEADPGAFLAAKIAAQNSDYASAANWYSRALLADPGNPSLLEGAVISNLALGEIGPAARLATALESAVGPGQIGHLALLAEEAGRDDFAAVLARTTPGHDQGALLDSLLFGWSQLGLGRMSDAAETFDKIAAVKGLEAFGLYHKALALATVGDLEGADDILSGRAKGEIVLIRRGVIAHAQILSQLERNPDALALIDKHFVGANDPEVTDLKRRLAAGEPLAFTTVRNPKDGIAEVFFTLAATMSGEVDNNLTLLHARIAQHLRPDNAEAALLTASVLEAQKQHDLAAEVYALVPPDSPVFHIAELGRADAVYAAGRKEAALEILQGLTRSHGHLSGIHVALGDAYRRDENIAAARKAYDTAISMATETDPAHWVVYFSRGICAERLGDFAAAEADMRKSLELNPNEPRVLNYLGYTFVDRNENLDEALDMIERAVAGEPGSGYIIDSLAWAYFRLGRYAEAVEPMERASVLEPVDPIITDHLGDVYWAVGRTREAQFQWHRALSFDPEEKDAVRIRRKLEIGLDAVLAEEGKPPLSQVEASKNGD